MANDRKDNRDELTGLFTRKALEEQMSQAVELAQKEGTTFSLVSVDIDHFKPVNDTHGHLVGDVVIQRVAEVIQTAVKDRGIAARYGGEEFVILLPSTEREQAFLLAEQLRSSMGVEYEYRTDEVSVKLTICLSGGVSAFPTDGRTTSEILRKADQALYRAKDTGRNKICIAEEERMAAKTSHYTLTQLARLSQLGKEEGVGEAVLLREALDDLLVKYKVSDIES